MKRVVLVLSTLVLTFMLSPVVSDHAAAQVGTEKWAFTTGSYVFSSPAIGFDGTIHVGSDDGNLYAVYGDSGGLARSPWPMFHHDAEHTGNVSGEFKEKAIPWIPLLLLDD